MKKIKLLQFEKKGKSTTILDETTRYVHIFTSINKPRV